MALVKCPEPKCGKLVSDKALMCPACGYPSPGSIVDPSIPVDDTTIFAPVYYPLRLNDNYSPGWRLTWTIANESPVQKNQQIATAQACVSCGSEPPYPVDKERFAINAPESGVLYQVQLDAASAESYYSMCGAIKSTRRKVYDDAKNPWNPGYIEQLRTRIGRDKCVAEKHSLLWKLVMPRLDICDAFLYTKMENIDEEERKMWRHHYESAREYYRSDESDIRRAFSYATNVAEWGQVLQSRMRDCKT